MNDTLVTGFEPFDGRTVNASWIAAQSLDNRARTLEVPVIWGTPLSLLTPICEEHCPTTIIAMGEGREGWFDIETIARNVRQERPDNAGNCPHGKLIVEDGPGHFDASIDSVTLKGTLWAAGVPIRISSDAGAFLCEEMLYSLELLRERYTALETVTFIHLPPFGSEVTFCNESLTCDEALLSRFAGILLDAIEVLRTGSQPDQIVHNQKITTSY